MSAITTICTKANKLSNRREGARRGQCSDEIHARKAAQKEGVTTSLRPCSSALAAMKISDGLRWLFIKVPPTLASGTSSAAADRS
jgi:hypothetical protein